MARSNRRIKAVVGQKSTVSFADFFAVYAALEGWNHIPEFHFDIIQFLENDNDWTNNTSVIQMFRNGAKSTVVAAYVVWKLVRDPKLIFLIQSADDNTAMKMIGDIQKIVNFHPMAKHLLGANNVWTAKQLRVTGSTSGRNMSVTARGIFSNVTGSRADIIIYDDIEVPKNSASAELRDRLRRNVSESSHLLNPSGKRIFVGTPHSNVCIYTEIVERGASEFRVPFLTEIVGEWPAMTGKCSWSERFTDEDVKFKLNECRSAAEFMSQYQLIAVSSEEAMLDPDRLIHYEAEMLCIEANKSRLMRLDQKEMSLYTSFWDPSAAKASGDDSVLTIVCLGKDGHIYIHRQFGLTGDDEQQCKQVRDYLMKFNVPTVVIETNGLGMFLEANLRKYTRGLGIAVNGQHTKTNKQESIMTAFATPLSLSIIHAHIQVKNGKLIQQIRDFNPNRARQKDDWIDSAAKAIHLLPITVGRGVTNKNDNFQPFRNFDPDAMTYERDYAFAT